MTRPRDPTRSWTFFNFFFRSDFFALFWRAVIRPLPPMPPKAVSPEEECPPHPTAVALQALHDQGFLFPHCGGTHYTERTWRFFFHCLDCPLCHEPHPVRNMCSYCTGIGGPIDSSVPKKAWIYCPRVNRQKTIVHKEIFREAYEFWSLQNDLNK